MKVVTAALVALVSTAAAADQTPQQLQQLVAPIALYPDELVAQVLAASTHPADVMQADRWMQQHPGLMSDQLAQQIARQPWDSSVKALTQFPSVLGNLDQNVSWAAALGGAYAIQPQAVLDAVQAMRQRARSAGTLTTTPEQNVTTQGQTIVIEPANPEVVYVPAYDPWTVYGPPLVAYPGWESVFVGPPGISFGIGFGIGWFGGFGWGWHHWHADWHGRGVFHDGRARAFRPRVAVPRFHAGFRGGFHGGGGHHR